MPDGPSAAAEPSRSLQAQSAASVRLQNDVKYAQKLYKETGNPIYAIWAIQLVSDPKIRLARGVNPAHAIPEWCLDWLYEACGSVMKIARGVRRRGRSVADETKAKRLLTPRAATQRIPQALGLTRQGKNAFLDFGVDKIDMDLSWTLEFLRSVDSRGDGRRKTLEDLKPALGMKRDVGVMRKRIKRGKRLQRD